jgi:hypothetical protein
MASSSERAVHAAAAGGVRWRGRSEAAAAQSRRSATARIASGKRPPARRSARPGGPRRGGHAPGSGPCRPWRAAGRSPCGVAARAARRERIGGLTVVDEIDDLLLAGVPARVRPLLRRHQVDEPRVWGRHDCTPCAQDGTAAGATGHVVDRGMPPAGALPPLLASLPAYGGWCWCGSGGESVPVIPVGQSWRVLRSGRLSSGLRSQAPIDVGR